MATTTLTGELEVTHTHTLSASGFPITNVTLYTNRAEVRRTVTVALDKGENEILVQDLPTSLVPESLRVSGQSTVQTTLKHVAVTFIPQASLWNVQSDKLKGLQDELADAQSEIFNLEKAIETLQTYISKVDPENVKVSDLESILDFHSSRAPALHSQLKRKREEKKNLETEIARELVRIEKEERDKIEGKNDALRAKAIIGVWMSEKAETDLTLTYAVYGASWTPLYDARISTTAKSRNEKPVKLTYKATISQSTGEDWNSVQLTLSTSTPSTTLSPPTLQPWNIHFYRPPPPIPVLPPRPMIRARLAAPAGGGGQSSSQLSDSGSVVEEDGPLPLMDALTMNATVEQGTFSATFEVPGKTTVLSDNATLETFQKYQGKTVTISELDLSANLEWESVPKVVEKVYLNSKVKNESEYHLLAGSVAVYLDGSFVANATLDNVSVNEDFFINLGIDPSIRITYLPRSLKSSSTGLLSKTKNHLFTQHMVIHNSKSNPITLLLKDQIPVSEDSSLIVKLLFPPIQTVNQNSASTTGKIDEKGWYEVSKGISARWFVDETISGNASSKSGKDEGLLQWKLEVEPGKKVNVAFEFEISKAAGGPSVVGIDKI